MAWAERKYGAELLDVGAREESLATLAKRRVALLVELTVNVVASKFYHQLWSFCMLDRFVKF